MVIGTKMLNHNFFWVNWVNWENLKVYNMRAIILVLPKGYYLHEKVSLVYSEAWVSTV